MPLVSTLLCLPAHLHNPTDCSAYLEVPQASVDPDVIWIQEENSIGIDVIRTLPALFSTLPIRAQQKTIVLLKAHTLTLTAQQALLKLLEEPPVHVHVILVVESAEQLIPTIQSRCVIQFGDTLKSFPTSSCLHQVLATQKSLASAMQLAEEMSKDKSQAATFCADLLRETQQALEKKPSSSFLQIAESAQEAIQALHSNVGARLTLEHLLFQIQTSAI